MPELPDVETFRRYVNSTSLHKTINNVKVKSAKVLDGTSAKNLSKTLQGEKFTNTRRHGKHLFLQISNGQWLMMHFGMTGSLHYFKDMDDDPKHDRLLISFENGYHLAYDCQRLLGKISLTEDIDSFITDKNLGDDALAISWDSFKGSLKKKRGSIKSALMDQKTLAGVGNIYVDEILFQVGIHPKTAVNSINEAYLEEVFESMRDVLSKAIDVQADPSEFPPSFMTPHRRSDQQCPNGDEKLKTVKISGRTTYFCPKHQKKLKK